MTFRVLALLFLVATSAACRGGPSVETTGEETEAAPISVEGVPVRRGEITESLFATGETAALSVVRLGSPIAGRLTFLDARPGDRLTTGEVAARVLSLENEAALHGFELLGLEGSLAKETEKGAMNLRAEVARWEVPIRAPFGGVVSDRLRNPGEQVAQGDVLLEVFDPHSLVVIAQVPAEQASRLSPGLEVEVSGPSLASRGRVDRLVPSIGSSSLTVPVRISLDAVEGRPLLHSAVRCRIVLAYHRGAILIPRSALLSASAAGAGEVMIAVDGRARMRRIETGLRSADDIEVIKGLADGEVVLARGQYSLPDGALVRIETLQPATPEGGGAGDPSSGTATPR